jgi:hypothetical protein
MLRSGFGKCLILWRCWRLGRKLPMQVRIPETIAVAAIAGLAALLSALFTAALYTY